VSERRQEEFDRDFTAMVSGLEMDGLHGDAEEAVPLPEPPDLRRLRDPVPSADDFNLEQALTEATPDEPDRSEYTPPPLPPMRPPRGLAVVAWALFGYALVALVLTIAGVRLPIWAGGAAIGAFAVALVLGWRLLPRDRDPGDGDGAVV
jgi:hypothetical protein